MKKKSYTSAPSKGPQRPLGPGEGLPSTPSAGEGLSAANTGGGIGRGASAFGESVMPAIYTELEEAPVYTGDRSKRKGRSLRDLLRALKEIADTKDGSGDIVEANFADFLIKKFAEQKEFDNSELFKALVMKILGSDLVFHNEIIKDLTNYYNRLIIMYMDSGLSINDAKRNAYSKVASKAKKYVE